jgi:hypothetical protein
VSIVTDIREARKLSLARSQPNLSFLDFSAPEMLGNIRSSLFPDVVHKISLSFVTRGPLACICCGNDQSTIFVHQLLNHMETPPAVFDLIFKHELLHLRIPPETQDGEVVQHPLTFWRAEKAIAPEREQAWAWMWENLWTCLRRRPAHQRIDVLSNWKQVWSQTKIDTATCAFLVAKTNVAEEQGGW